MMIFLTTTTDNSTRYTRMTAVRTACAILLFTLVIHAVHAENNTQLAFIPFTATYTVKKSGISLGTATFRLQALDTHRWKYTSHIKPTGVASLFSREQVHESSTVNITPLAIQPLKYTYERKNKPHDAAAVTFDWDQRHAQITRDSKNTIHPLTGGEQDHYSLILSLMRFAASITTKASTRSYTVLGKKIANYHYTAAGTTSTPTPMRTFKTVQITQQKRGKRHMHYWFAPALNHVPVRIVQYKHNKPTLELILTRFNGST